MGDTPNIRFKGFVDDWEQRKFSELYEKVSRKNDLTYGRDAIISVANMYYKQDSYITNDSYLLTYNIFELGDIAFEGNKSKNFAHGRFVENTIGNGIVSHVFDVFRPIMPKYDLLFWKYLINNEGVMGNILLRSTKASTMMTNLVANDFLQESILVPSYEEQREIGTFLDALDHLIILHQHKCDEIRELKKYMLRKMFPENGQKVPELRFAGFTGDWEQRKLGDCSDLITKGTTPSSFCENGNVAFVKIEALREKRVIKELCSVISKEIHEGELARSILKENDIVFAIAGATVGKCAIITGDILPANTNQALAIIRLKSSIDRDFVYFSLTSKQMKIYINQGKSVGAQPNLSLSQMNAFEFLCPCKQEEQQKIGVYFSALENLITLHQRKCDELKNIKKFMLKNMFV